MADEALDKPSFGILDTELMGMGDMSLLADVEEKPKEEIKPVLKEEKKPETPKKEEKKKEEETPKKDYLKAALEGEEEEEEEKTDEKKDEEENKEGTFEFNSLAKDLFRLGIFTNEDDEQEEEITTPDQLLERFNKEKQKGAMTAMNAFIGQFGEDYQKAFEAIFVNGVPPKEFFTTFTAIGNLAEIDLAKETNQVAVVKQGLLDQGFEEEDINAEVEKLKQYGDLEKTANRFHKVLLKKESTKLQEMEASKQAEIQSQVAYKQQYNKNVIDTLTDKLKNKEFDGIPLNQKLAEEVRDYLLVDKYKTASGEKLTEFDKAILELKKPENHSKKVKIALLLKTLEKDPTLSTIQKTAITKQTNQLFEEVARQKTKSGAKEEKKEQPTRWWK